MTADAFINITADFPAEIVHTLYAYNENDKIILFTPLGHHDPDQDDGILGGIGPLMMSRVVIDVTQRSVTYETLDASTNTEFGRVRDSLVASQRRARYGFSALQIGNGFNFTGMLKWDFTANEGKGERVGTINFNDAIVGGEPVFVPRAASVDNVDESENGYLSMFHWDSASRTSKFVLFDAASFNDTPVVELSLPRKVPLGFHGWWLSKDEIDLQLNAK